MKLGVVDLSKRGRLTLRGADVGSVRADTVETVEPWPIETVLTVWEL